MKQSFLAAYEDNGSDQEEEKEDEAISLYATTDFDLWIIDSHRPILPTKLDSEGDICNKKEEKYNEEDPIEESKTEEEVIGMMAMSNSETEDDANQLLSNLSCVKLDIKELESNKVSLEKQDKDLKNQVLGLTSKNEKSLEIRGKGKISDLQDKLEKELKIANDNFCDVECSNKVLHENLEKSNNKLFRLSKWHRSFDALNWLNENCSSNKSRIGYRKFVPKFDQNSETPLVLLKNVKKEEDPKAKVRGNNQDWYLDSGCSRHMTGEKKNFLSLTIFQGGNVSFGNGKKGQITCIGKVGKSLSHATKDVYYVGKRHSNVYKISIISLPQSERTCLRVVEDDPLICHKTLGHANLSQLNKLAVKDLVLGLPKIEFISDKDEDYDIGFTGDRETMPSLRNLCALTTFLSQKPKNKTVISTRWVFRNKLDEQENITRNKIRLVVQRYNREEGIDYDETFAPGLKLAPRAWYERLSKFLLANNFVRGKVDTTLFLRSRGKNILIVQVYMDEIIFGDTNEVMCKEFAEMMGNELKMSMIGELNFFLGLQIKQTHTGTIIHQQKYIKELLKKFNMDSSKTIDTPIVTATKLDLDEERKR
ncbi:uncharacterized protein [Nicotiana sylvestris]|uniref:uncharacterized protein n=1 Tax=Nicotiana sylvestris TaxID=4096 RepID=UPI00388C57B8